MKLSLDDKCIYDSVFSENKGNTREIVHSVGLSCKVHNDVAFCSYNRIRKIGGSDIALLRLVEDLNKKNTNLLSFFHRKALSLKTFGKAVARPAS